VNLTGFQRPRKLEPELSTLTNTYGKFIAQPFERGFGTTVGNALRRVLLSSIEGAAVTAVKVAGILHEFSPLPGVVEDATDIILNLRGINFRLHSRSAKTITVKASGEREVKAGDLEVDPDIEILNPEAHVATLTGSGSLQMEMRLKNARGYVPADKNFDSDLDVGYIPLDSTHSPVTKVRYLVEDARLGQTTDYDKLILEIWTNGATRPHDALATAARILCTHLEIYIDFEEKIERAESKATEDVELLGEQLNRSVDELELSVRSCNCLKNANIRTIGELIQKTEAEMLTTKNFGRKSLNEIKEILQSMNLSFGMKIDPSMLKKPKPQQKQENS
jgi:DNA-directed RNA polymerase subunit alpha